MNTYGERLESAMREAGFGGPGGQSRLAEQIGARSQTINQALKGGSKELSATFHVRAAIRLGVKALWLSEGRGPRYEPAGPQAAVFGADDFRPYTTQVEGRLPAAYQAPMLGRAAPLMAMDSGTSGSHDQYEDTERLVRLLRELPKPMRDAIKTLIYTASDPAP